MQCHRYPVKSRIESTFFRSSAGILIDSRGPVFDCRGRDTQPTSPEAGRILCPAFDIRPVSERNRANRRGDVTLGNCRRSRVRRRSRSPTKPATVASNAMLDGSGTTSLIVMVKEPLGGLGADGSPPFMCTLLNPNRPSNPLGGESGENSPVLVGRPPKNLSSKPPLALLAIDTLHPLSAISAASVAKAKQPKLA
jgi:hypothetical protein